MKSEHIIKLILQRSTGNLELLVNPRVKLDLFIGVLGWCKVNKLKQRSVERSLAAHEGKDLVDIVFKQLFSLK